MQPTYEDVLKDQKPKSVYDPEVDYHKVLALPPQDRARLFPNDFGRNGMPLGDF